MRAKYPAHSTKETNTIVSGLVFVNNGDPSDLGRILTEKAD